jgi:hypothetical protein
VGGQVVLDRLAQADPVLGGELENHCGDERLGDAADPELIARPRRGAGGEIGQPGRARPVPGSSRDPDQGSGLLAAGQACPSWIGAANVKWAGLITVLHFCDERAADAV